MRRVQVRVAERKDRDGFFAFWTDPLTGKRRNTKLGARRMRDAIVEGGRLEDELNAGGGSLPVAASWESVRAAAVDRWVSTRGESMQTVFRCALDHFEEIIGKPRNLGSITAEVIDRYKAGVAVGRSPSTVNTYLRHIRSFLLWAKRQNYIARVPEFQLDRVVTKMRGGPISEPSFQKLLAGVRSNRGEYWARLCECMYYGGLRISEAMRLSWDTPPFQVDFSGRFPRFVIRGDGQKSGKNETAPMTPQFAEWLRALPEPHTGLVCGLECSVKVASKVISAEAKAAGVDATAHDLRRSFGTRWALQVKPAVLQRLMRHANIQTTCTYYVNIDTDDISEILYDQAGD